MNEVQELSTRDKVNEIEKLMREMIATDPHVFELQLPTRHWLGHKSYARELLIPKDTILTGKIHKYKQINILLEGEMIVLIGDRLVKLQGPYIVVAPAGTKRLAKALTDCRWLTISGTDETDVDKIENELVANDEEEYQEFLRQLQPELPLEAPC